MNLDKIPLGVFDAKLDFKIWSKRIIAINCYFIRIDTEERFVVTVYCNQGNIKVSTLAFNGGFFTVSYRRNLLFKVIKNDKGKVLLEKAEPAQHVTQ
jgi:hypothetical protein